MGAGAYMKTELLRMSGKEIDRLAIIQRLEAREINQLGKHLIFRRLSSFFIHSLLDFIPVFIPCIAKDRGSQL